MRRLVVFAAMCACKSSAEGPPAIDAAVPIASAKVPALAAPSASASSVAPVGCSLVGTFVGFGRATNVVELHADGTGSWSAIGATSGGPAYLAPQSFRYRLEGTTFVFNQGAGWQSPFVCAQGTAGRYQLTFADDCASLTLKALEDACTARKTELDHSTAKRRAK
ncbi:MAG: hypothetical protein ACXVEF_04105 [Polyangiales bacterium]